MQTETSGGASEVTDSRRLRRYAGAVLRKLAALASVSARLWPRSKRVAAALGESVPQRIWLRVVPFVLLWGRPFVGPGNRGIPVRFAFRGRSIGCVLGELCEYEVLEEVFVDEAYGSDLPAQALAIVDLGSHVGLSALYFAALYPGARVLAVEPNPTLLGRLRRNLARVERATVAPVAAADRDGQGRLRVVSGSWSGRLEDTAGFRVPTVTLGTLLRRHHFDSVDVLKFDIEGAEFRALQGADLSAVKALVGELHPSDADQLHTFVGELEPEFEVQTRPLASRWLLQARRR
jgi:FkbM family methyltransferase